MAKIIKSLDNFNGDAVLVEHKDKFYAVSHLEAAFDTGMPETLVFQCDKDGNVTDWGEVVGGRGVSREEAIEELEQKFK